MESITVLLQLKIGAFNRVPYLPANTPAILSAITGGALATKQEFYGPRTQARVIPLNAVVRVVINNYDTGSHPFHLHGHVFQVLYTGLGYYDPINDSKNLRFNNTIRRDTSIVPSGGHMVIQWIANSAGVFGLHCHIDWHFAAGLSALFVQGVAELGKIAPSQSIINQCKLLGRSVSGNAAGYNDTTTFTGFPVLSVV